VVELQRLIFGRIRNSAIRVLEATNYTNGFAHKSYKHNFRRVIKDGPEAIHGTSDESDASNLLVVPGTALPVKPPPPAALTHLRSTHCLSSLELLKVLQQLPERLRNALCGIAPHAFLRIRFFSFVLNMKSHKHMFC
jgi:hypothetical protein